LADFSGAAVAFALVCIAQNAIKKTAIEVPMGLAIEVEILRGIFFTKMLHGTGFEIVGTWPRELAVLAP
jgi:hypothetical protein